MHRREFIKYKDSMRHAQKKNKILILQVHLPWLHACLLHTLTSWPPPHPSGSTPDRGARRRPNARNPSKGTPPPPSAIEEASAVVGGGGGCDDKRILNRVWTPSPHSCTHRRRTLTTRYESPRRAAL